MKQNIIYTVLLFLIILSSCSSYEKGPSISLKKAEKRIIGTWEVNDVLVNDKTDHLALLKEKDYEYTFKQDGIFIKEKKSKKRADIELKSKWSFKDKKTILVLEYYFIIDNLEISEKYEYIILKLTDKDLWVKDNETRQFQTASSFISERHYTKISK